MGSNPTLSAVEFRRYADASGSALRQSVWPARAGPSFPRGAGRSGPQDDLDRVLSRGDKPEALPGLLERQRRCATLHLARVLDADLVLRRERERGPVARVLERTPILALPTTAVPPPAITSELVRSGAELLLLRALGAFTPLANLTGSTPFSLATFSMRLQISGFILTGSASALTWRESSTLRLPPSNSARWPTAIAR